MKNSSADTLIDMSSECVDGTIASVVFRNDETGFTVLHVEVSTKVAYRKQEVTVLGTCAAAWKGEEIHAEGEWVDDPVRGRQFKATSIMCIAPKSVEGIRRYLASGLIYGIGPVLANRIVDKFGADTINVLDHHSGRLTEIPKLGPKKIEQIRASWRDGKAMRSVLVFTQQYGISVAKTTKIYKKYGADTIAIIKADPYRLCRDIWGIGFQTADNIAMAVGLAKDSPVRARASILYTLQSEADDFGHCWTSEPDLLLHAQEKVGIDVEILAEALRVEKEEGRVIVEGPVIKRAAKQEKEGELQVVSDPSEEQNKVYLRDIFFAERSVAKKLKTLLATEASFAPISPEAAIPWWEKATGFSLAPAQWEAVTRTLRSKVSVITGGPGVGKTTIIRALVDIYAARKGAHRIHVQMAAPTGRAAKRMTESVLQSGGPLSAVTSACVEPAQTLHRLLKYNPQTNEFTFDSENPLEGDVFIFDETSMVDIRLMRDLVEALPDNATLILVGDTDQLPSVGPGNVLGDCIASGVIPTTHLTQIFRQDSTGLIVRNAHHVNAGEPFETRSGETDFYFVAKENPEDVLRLALDFMTTRIPNHFKMEPLQDVQVLTPMRKNSLGAENLNFVIQNRLNPSGEEIKRGMMSFKAGDRVMQLRNNYEKDVFNGDVGFVKSVDVADRSLIVIFDGKPVKYGSGDLDELTLAYATTIHKSQGSEYPAVVVLLHNQHFMMLQRNLLYTAITRGKKLVLVIGSHWAVKKAIETNTVRERRTSLAKRLAVQAT